VIRFRHSLVARRSDLPPASAMDMASAAAQLKPPADQWAGARAPLRRLQQGAPSTLRTRVSLQLHATATSRRW